MNDKKDLHRERLKKIIAKKFDTTMIFPLSQFEAAFGEIWGQNKPEETLTPEERVMRAKWKECRNNILNVGNQQKRNANAELEMYQVIWSRYKSVFLPMDVYNNRNNQGE